MNIDNMKQGSQKCIQITQIHEHTGSRENNTIQGKTYHIICSSLKILCIGHVADYFIRIMLCMNNIKVIIITRKTPISGCFCGTTSPFSIFSAGFQQRQETRGFHRIFFIDTPKLLCCTRFLAKACNQMFWQKFFLLMHLNY